MSVRFEVEQGIARVTLARPEVRNALNDEVMLRVEEALERSAKDPDIRVIVLTGEGKAFSAGADLDYMRKIAQAGTEGNKRDARQMGALFHKIAASPKPVVARVGGPAIGGGVGLMAACDVVVAVEEAFFQFSEVRLGLVPAVISPFCIRRMGPAIAQRLFLTAEKIDAQSAQRVGLVDRIAKTGELDAATHEVVEMLRLAGPNALAEAKKLVTAVSNLPPNDVLSYTSECISRLRASDEAQEGMAAFLSKQQPSWVSRKG